MWCTCVVDLETGDVDEDGANEEDEDEDGHDETDGRRRRHAGGRPRGQDWTLA